MIETFETTPPWKTIAEHRQLELESTRQFIDVEAFHAEYISQEEFKSSPTTQMPRTRSEELPIRDECSTDKKHIRKELSPKNNNCNMV